MEISKEDLVNVEAYSKTLSRQQHAVSQPLAQVELQYEVARVMELLPKDTDENGFLLFQDTDLISIYSQMHQRRVINLKDRFPVKVLEGRLYLICTVIKLESLGMTGQATKRGHLEEQTNFKLSVALKDNKKLKIHSDQVEEKQIFKQNFNFQELGIGGLDKEFEEIFRKAFNLRRFPPKVLEKYGYKHLKGMLLYGPPGTGKTLIAR